MAKRAACLIAEPGNRVLASKATVATTVFSQFVGWIGRKNVGPDSALGLPRCSCVHTFGLRIAIDVAYCDREGRVLRVVEGLLPNRVSPIVRSAYWAWEMRAGGAEKVGLAGRVAVGDRIILRTTESTDARPPEGH